jgi:hypothetical protein
LSPAGEPALKRVGPAVTLPKLSIAAKLYVIFALMAATTLALSTVAVRSARDHAAITDTFESANNGSSNVARVNGLLYGVIMETAASIYRLTGKRPSNTPMR